MKVRYLEFQESMSIQKNISVLQSSQIQKKVMYKNKERFKTLVQRKGI